jgi:hypothetical protein
MVSDVGAGDRALCSTWQPFLSKYGLYSWISTDKILWIFSKKKFGAAPSHPAAVTARLEGYSSKQQHAGCCSGTTLQQRRNTSHTPPLLFHVP